MSPSEVVILSVVKAGVSSKDLFQAQGVDMNQLSPVIEALKSSGYLEELQSVDQLGANAAADYSVTDSGEQKLVSVANQLSDTWGQIVTAMSADNNENNIAAFVKLVSDNEEWIYVMVILGLITQEAAQEIFDAVNRLAGKDDQGSARGDRLHNILKDSVENYVGSFVQYD